MKRLCDCDAGNKLCNSTCKYFISDNLTRLEPHPEFPSRVNTPYYTAWFNGRLYCLPMLQWSQFTGKTTACMCARRRQVREGFREHTIEQILGIDDIDHSNIERHHENKVMKESNVIAIQRGKTDIASRIHKEGLFLRKPCNSSCTTL